VSDGPIEPDGPAGELVALPDLDGDGRAVFEHQGRTYAVFTVDGEVVVTDGTCPHRGGPIGEGVIRDGAVVCPWHWYVFDLRTGECRVAYAYAEPLRRHPVRLVGGRPHARLAAPAQRSWADVLRRHAQSAAPSTLPSTLRGPAEPS
jgi:nitrite reductase (NADH) small subunit